MELEMAVGLWHFIGVPVQTSEVKCHECGEFSPLSAWRDGEVFFRGCFGHAAMVCPKCDSHFDYAGSERQPFEIRTSNPGVGSPSERRPDKGRNAWGTPHNPYLASLAQWQSDSFVNY